MKNRKAIILIALVLAISLFTTGCMNKVNESIGTKIGEKVLEKALGEDVKVDGKDNSLSIDTEEGNFQIGEGLDWPTDKMNPLPKPNANVISVSEQKDDQSTTVMVHFPNKKESIDYLENVRGLGLIEGSFTESEGYFSYMGYGTDNSQITVSSQGLDDDLTLGIINFSKDNIYAKEFFKKVDQGEPALDLTGVDMTDDFPWPEDKIGRIPELNGKITDINITEENVYVGLNYVKREDVLSFIQDVKALGFTKSNSQTISPDNILFMSRDDKDYGLSIRWYNNEANINYTLP